MPTAQAVGGLQVTVYNMLGYNNAPPTPTEDKKIYETVVPNIDFQFGSGGIFTNRSEDVVVKFEGTITSPVTGDVIFYAPADDGVKLYIDGVDVINDWYDKGGGGSESQPISFTANVPKPITLWYYENGGGAWVQLNWQLPGTEMTVVPAEAFNGAVAKTIGAPTNLVVTDSDTSTALTWQAPSTGNTQPERYAISFSADGGGWGIATGNVGDANALNTTITIDHSLLESLKPSGTVWSFHIRSDNDTLAVYSENSNVVTLKIGQTAEEIAAEQARLAAIVEAARLAELERQRLAAVEAARIAAEQEAARQAAIAEAARQAAIAAQKAYEAEQARLLALEYERQRIAAEKKAEEERIAAIAAAIEAEAKRLAEEEAKQKADEEALIKWLEEKRIAFEEAEAKAKAEELARLAELERIANEAKAKAEEEARVAEEARLKAEAEAKALADEAARLEAERIEAERKAAEELANQVKPTPTPEPISTPTPKPEPQPEPKVTPQPEPLEPEPVEEVVQEVVQVPPPVVVPEPEPTPETVVLEDDTNLEELAPDTPIELENGVVLTAEVVIALQLLENPGELLAAVFTDPAEAFKALSNIGADMSPEVREKSEEVVVAAIIAGGIATQAAASAGAVAAYRRKP
jgi:hypothetical protein